MNEKKRFGVMIDASNGAVMRKEEVKKFASVLSKLGYNMLQLYTEDTYEISEEPRFGYLRGGYLKNDLKEIDAHCRSVGIELIPCIQTLAHLERIFRWSEYEKINDVNDILLADDERTYELIENMFKTLSECFSSRTVNLGMDEAHLMGLGKYLRLHGCVDRFELFIRHLNKVVGIAKKYGFRPLIWSDMFFRLLGNGGYENAAHGADETLASARYAVPDGLGLIYWEYFFYKSEDYARSIGLHKQLCDEVWFAGTVHTYIGYCTSNALSNDTLRPAMQAVKDEKTDNVLITLWGGDECSFNLALPSLCYARCVYEGITDDNEIKRRFELATGENYDAFFALDAANTCFKNYLELPEVDFCKYALFTDLFNGYQDKALTLGAADSFLLAAKRLEKLKVGSRYEYLFDTQIELLKTLYLKHDLGILLRKAYADNDKTELGILRTRIISAEKQLEKFYYAFRKQYLIENDPHGTDVFDIKIGGLMRRWRSCAERLDDYINGKTEGIPELSARLLEYKDTAGYMQWSKIVSVNKIV